MIFKETHHLIPDRKWQTRRPVKPGDRASHDEHGNIVAVYREVGPRIGPFGRRKRLLWKVGKDYAKQPGRGQKAVGRTPPIKAIRRERLQEITLQDLQAELGQPGAGYALVFFFIEIWDRLYRKPYRWEDNLEVWVLTFKKVEVSDE